MKTLGEYANTFCYTGAKNVKPRYLISRMHCTHLHKVVGTVLSTFLIL